MSENMNYRSSMTMGSGAGAEANLEMDSVSVTQRFFSIDMGQEGKGSDAVVLNDTGGTSSHREPNTLDKIPRRRAPLYAFLAFMSLLLIGVLTQDDIEKFFKQPLSIHRLGKAVWAANPMAAPSENIKSIPPGDVVIPTAAMTTLEVPKPSDATKPLPSVPAVPEMVVENPPTPSMPSIRNRSSQRTVRPPIEKGWAPTKTVLIEAEVNDVSPFEQNAESTEVTDSAPSKHPIPDRAANPFDE
jgi:hypothetical protein